jgi:Holliday junction DNA helicase RuvA
MIGYLRGRVVERRIIGDTAVELVVDVGGVGYRVFVSPRLASSVGAFAAGPANAPVAAGANGALPKAAGRTTASHGAASNGAGSPSDGGRMAPEVTLSVHTHVREGAITLYGFADADERRAFELLLGAHGVGPALALAIVSVHGANRLVEIVTGDDIDALTLVPGVGRKTAMRLLVDLKSRFGELDGTTASMVSLLGGTPSAASEVADALAQLGYGPEEVRAAVRALPTEGSVEELLRSALRELAPRR